MLANDQAKLDEASAGVQAVIGAATNAAPDQAKAEEALDVSAAFEKPHATADEIAASGLSPEAAGIKAEAAPHENAGTMVVDLAAQAAPRVFIAPSPGRQVWYRAKPGESLNQHVALASTIAGVIDDHTVNLAVLGFDGSGPYARQNVPLIHDGQVPPGACTWMPFQKQQAVKADLLDAQLANKG